MNYFLDDPNSLSRYAAVVENQLAFAQLKNIWHLVRGEDDALEHINLIGHDPVYPSSFFLATAAQTVIGAAALAATQIWKHKTGEQQQIEIEAQHAAIEFRSERYFRVNDQGAPSLWDSLAGVYQTGDGRFVRLHTNFPHHRENVLKLLSCNPERESVQKALEKWRAFEFEDAANRQGCVVAAMRARLEWEAHPQAQAVRNLPLISIEKIGEADPRPFSSGPFPLSSIKVLDLTRIVAGPVGARALAAYGADVMRIHSPNLPALDWLDRDTGRGKRSAFIDLNTATGRQDLLSLVKDADIFLQAYRPQSLKSKGLGPEDLAAQNPGLVYVSLSAYGPHGPWSSLRGFDSLVQTATGFNAAEAEAFNMKTPKELPCQALDHAAGYLVALGAMMARLRQAKEGGSWHVQISLVQAGDWIWSLGQSSENLSGRDFSYNEIQKYLERSSSVFGEIAAVKHSVKFSSTPARWEKGPTHLGAVAARW